MRKQISTSADVPLQVHETKPTEHPPGSKEKIKVLTERYENGEPLWHVGDNKECREKPGNRSMVIAEPKDDFGDGVFDGEDDE